MLSQLQPSLSVVFSIEGFMTYLRTTAGGNKDKESVKSIANDLIEFYNVTSQSSEESFGKIDSLFNRSNIQLFLDYIKKRYKPAAIWEIIQRLKMAIQYIMSLSSRKDYYTTGCTFLRLLTDLQDNSQLQKASARRISISKWSCVNSKQSVSVHVRMWLQTIAS